MNSLLRQLPKLRLEANFKARHISLYPVLKVKEIHAVQNEKDLVISGQIVPSGRESLLVQNKHPTVCPVCASGLDIKHTDVLILSQFLRSDGCMLPRRITGLCKASQRRISTLVAMAQKAGLMQSLTPANSKKDPRRRYRWKSCNTYFDESTIQIKNIK